MKTVESVNVQIGLMIFQLISSMVSAGGKAAAYRRPEALWERITCSAHMLKLKADDMALLIYTSGTTGAPKARAEPF